jgi:V-type H+-transporting ATPase subunit D
VQNKKQRDTAAQDVEIRKKQAAQAEREEKMDTAPSNPDILGDQEDTDVIF